MGNIWDQSKLHSINFHAGERPCAAGEGWTGDKQIASATGRRSLPTDTCQAHLPMQKRANTRSSTASLTSSPVISPS